MTKLTEEEIAQTVEGVIEEWFPDYQHMGTGDDTRQYRVVAISDSRLPDRTVYEIRDHNDGQKILGRYVVNIDVIRIDKMIGTKGQER